MLSILPWFITGNFSEIVPTFPSVVTKGQVKEFDLRNIGMYKNMMMSERQNIIVSPLSEDSKK